MDPLLLFTYVLAAFLIIVLPGPNVLVIVSTSLSHGVKSGLLTVSGTTTAMAIQLTVVALGTTWLVEVLTNGFTWLRWLGVLYLAYLGWNHLRAALSEQQTTHSTLTAKGSFLRGFVVSLTNPKTLLFFSAFLPQFVAPQFPYLPQILVLSLIFLLLAAVLDSLYALLADRLRGYLAIRQLDSIRHGVSAALFLGSGLWLALTRRI